MNSVCLISNNMIFSFKLIFDRFFKYLCSLGFYERWSNKFIKYRSSMLSFFSPLSGNTRTQGLYLLSQHSLTEADPTSKCPSGLKSLNSLLQQE